MAKPFIVGFGGTTRPGSSGERLVRAVLGKCQEAGAATQMFGGSELAALPHFEAARPERSTAQKDFVAAVARSDAIVIGSPSYHGGVSGLVKNAIDLLEDLRDADRVYFDDRPVGLIVSAAGWQGTGVTLSALRGIVHAMRGWPTPLGIAVNTEAGRLFDNNDRVADETVQRAIDEQARQIMKFVNNCNHSQHNNGQVAAEAL